MHKFTCILGAAIACCTMPGVSAAQQQTLDGARASLRDFKAESRKGEFETTQEFEARRARIQQRIVALLRGDYPATFNVLFETYNADTQILPVFGPMGSLKLVVPPSDARWIKEQSSARGSGTFWLEENGKTFLIGRLTIKVGTRTFQTEPSSIRIQILKTEPFDLPNSPAQRGPLAFSPGGGYIATNRPHDNWVFNGKTGEKLHETRSCLTPTFSFDDRYFACAWIGGDFSPDSIHVKVLDLETGDVSYLREPTADDQPAIDFSPLTNVLAVEVLRDSGPAVLLWDVDRAELVKTIPLSGVGAVTDLEFGPRGEVLAIVGVRDARTYVRAGHRLWMLDVQTGDVASTSREGGIIQFLPDGGRYLASSSIHSARTSEVVARLEKGGGSYVSPDGSVIAGSSGKDGLLWDAATGVIVRELEFTSFYGFFRNGDLLLPRSRLRIMKRGNWE